MINRREAITGQLQEIARACSDQTFLTLSELKARACPRRGSATACSTAAGWSSRAEAGMSTAVSRRIGQLIRMLSSDKPGEVAATVFALKRALSSISIDLHGFAHIIETHIARLTPETRPAADAIDRYTSRRLDGILGKVASSNKDEKLLRWGAQRLREMVAEAVLKTNEAIALTIEAGKQAGISAARAQDIVMEIFAPKGAYR